ncbi:hypothetical protein ACLBXM_17320 [Xanthobacteraceae bacterium A53D]
MPLAYTELAPPEPPRSSSAAPGVVPVACGPLLARITDAALAPNAHLLVLGTDSLNLSLALWKAGFTNVGCAPRNLDCVAHGISDGLIITGAPSGAELDRLLARARFSLRDRGWAFLHFAVARGLSLPRLYAQMTAAGLVVGEVCADGRGGLWLSARKRAALRVVGGRDRMALAAQAARA